jgi:hypothetical protein
LIIVYIGAGFYLLAMRFGLLHREYMSKMDDHRRLGLTIFGVGLIILGLYNIHYYYGR